MWLIEVEPSRVTHGQVERMLQHHENPNLPPDFD